MQPENTKFVEGQLNYERGNLELSVSRIELSIKEGASAQGSFHVLFHGENTVKGVVYSSSLRMSVLTSSFEGVSAEIFYSFHAEGMEEGDIEKGELSIVSSAGEYTIPFAVSIEHGIVSSSMGPVKNLFHFANLARSNWSEAVALFYSDAFASVFHGNDLAYLGTYRGLSRMRGNEQNVDEFLNAINKKQRIEYIPMEEQIRIEDPYGVEEGRITLTRNGWGFTALAIEVDGDFLSVERQFLTDDHFLGNLCTFAFYVDASMLHAGNNYGSVRIYNTYTSLTIPITVTKPLSRMLHRSMRSKMQELNIHLMEYYSAFRMRKISAEMWLKQTGEIVEKMSALDEKNHAAKMFQAQLLITNERVNEAKWILDRLASELTYGERKPEEWCYYLYLTSLIQRDAKYVDEVTAEVEQIFAQNPENWRIAWLLLYLREDFAKSPYKKWMFLEQQFYGGCISPVLYVEAVTLAYANPTLLMKLTEYELQVINYAAKHDLLKRDLILQIHALVKRTHTYSERILFILKKCYQVAEDDETLELICGMLIRGNKTSEEDFAWYSLGVERELRVTRLFEYYMLSIPASYQRELPRMIMMYFAFHAELTYERKAFLYANVHRHKDKYAEIYESYRPLIDEFIYEQIRQGHITQDLAYLYTKLVNPSMIQDEMMQGFIPILFSHLITVEDENVRQIVLIYDKLAGEMMYPVENGKAIIPIYSSEHTILLQDGAGNRYADVNAYETMKLMIPGKFVKMIGERVAAHIGLDLYLCGNTETSLTITVRNAACFRRLWKSDRITEAFRNEIRLKLARFYYENDMISETDEVLESLDPVSMGERERAQFLQLLVNRGMYDAAYDWLTRFGEGQADVSALVRLISRLIVRMEYKADDKLLRLSHAVFGKKRYDENILRYLVAYYQGTTRELRDLWKAGREFELDVNELCERILVQYLFTGFYIGEKDELFFNYVKQGAKRAVEVAFLSCESYGFFVKEQVIDGKIMQCMTRLFYRGEELSEVCKLAYLKYYAEISDKGEEVLQLCIRFLGECMARNVYFPFFREYGKILPDLSAILDSTMVEYHAASSAKVVIHYVIERADGACAYVTQPMKNMYNGIFVHSFVLFFGETLQYYITESNGGEEQLTESGTISKSDTDEVSVDSRYAILNDMMVASTLQDYATFNRLYAEYEEKRYLMEMLFPIG